MPRRSLTGRLAPLLLTGVLLSACGSNGPTIAPATSAPPAPPSSGASPSPSAASESPGASDANAALYARIEEQVRQLRGLQATSEVTRAVLDTEGLKDFVTTSFEKDNPRELVDATEQLYRAFNLMSGDATLEDLYIELLTSQVAGLYDDETKHMYVISQSGAIGPTEEVTYAHEYTHALQDQTWGLKSIVGDAKDQGDRTLARTALVEGDATLLMSLWAQRQLTAAELGVVAGSASPESQAVLDRMPKILGEPLLFPYTAGLSMVVTDYGTGGWQAVDDRYTKTAPDSTEQVLHADKLAAKEKPVAVTFPADLASRLGSGWKVSLEDTLGEFQLEILLRDGGGVSAATSGPASQGWGGDREALVEGPGGAQAAVLDTAWDSAADANEFQAAAKTLVAKLKGVGRSAAVLAPSGRRVVVISASDGDALARMANVLGLAG